MKYVHLYTYLFSSMRSDHHGAERKVPCSVYRRQTKDRTHQHKSALRDDKSQIKVQLNFGNYVRNRAEPVRQEFSLVIIIVVLHVRAIGAIIHCLWHHQTVASRAVTCDMRYQNQKNAKIK